MLPSWSLGERNREERVDQRADCHKEAYPGSYKGSEDILALPVITPEGFLEDFIYIPNLLLYSKYTRL